MSYLKSKINSIVTWICQSIYWLDTAQKGHFFILFYFIFYSTQNGSHVILARLILSILLPFDLFFKKKKKEHMVVIIGVEILCLLTNFG